ncbi:M48 family metallopeptidase [Terasakiella pusilla]|uniref:M48 family metallopeptidase n=1 Tax=Terasakiella pusilla TaxID=64973 RepID=UPI003AA97E9E
MTPIAAYMDGQSAKRQKVYLEFASSLLIFRDEKGEVLSSWPVSDIAPTDRVKAGETLVLSCQKRGHARLHVDDENTRNWLFNIIPGLVGRTVYKRESRLAWILSGSVLALALVFYFVFPLIMQGAVRFVPVAWEKETFKGAGLKLAEQIGAQDVCTSPEGVAVLQNMVIRLVGQQQARQLDVLVVDHKMVNAFATPGQNVVLMRGLIDKADSADEVVGVLAHELGHVYHRHPMQSALRGAGIAFVMTALSGGSGAEFAALLAETSYSRDHERAADDFALTVLSREKISTQGLAHFFEKMGEENGSLERFMSLISTHPMSEERAASLSKNTEGGPAMSEEDWQALKEICATTTDIATSIPYAE